MSKLTGSYVVGSFEDGFEVKTEEELLDELSSGIVDPEEEKIYRIVEAKKVSVEQNGVRLKVDGKVVNTSGNEAEVNLEDD